MKKFNCKDCIYRKWGIFGYYCRKFNKWYEPLSVIDIINCTLWKDKR